MVLIRRAPWPLVAGPQVTALEPEPEEVLDLSQQPPELLLVVPSHMPP